MSVVAVPPAPLTELAAIERPPVPDPRKQGWSWRKRVLAVANAGTRAVVLLGLAAMVAWPTDYILPTFRCGGGAGAARTTFEMVIPGLPAVRADSFSVLVSRIESIFAPLLPR